MPHDDDERSTQRIARLIAVVAGIAGVLLCGVVPLLPVKQTTATVLWPQGSKDGHVTDITAPLVSGAPRALDISIPCQAIATLPAGGGLVLSTLPSDGFETGKNGLFVRANKDSVVVAFRDTVAAVAPRPAIAAGACSVLHIWADAGGAAADFVGIPGAAGKLAPEKKPQVGGVFTDLKVPAQPGLSVRVDIDTRFITAPTMLKKAVMGLGALSVLTALVALGTLDRQSGRRAPRNWRHIWRAGIATWFADIGVVGTLLLWHVIGATSSDDGYNLTIARVSRQAGYIANYYRFFGTTEAPFDWYPAVLAHLATVSTAGVWMRLPATLAGIVCWLIISRYVLRRLGPGKGGLASNRVAVWTAGAVFLAAWLPFNNGLRPEPLIALGVIATWALVESAIASRRLVPAAVAIIVAMLTATLAPQGLIAVAALLTTLGLIMVLSASGVRSYDDDGSAWVIFGRQVLWTVIGLVACYLALRVPVRLMRRTAFTGYALTIVLLVLVLVPGVGHYANGSRGWFVVAGFSMQPSELTKIAFAIWGAHLLAARRMERASLREMLIPLVPAAVIALALIVAQPDLGQTVSLGIILLALLWYAGLPLRVFLSSLLAVIVSAAILAVSEGYRSDRVRSWLDPAADSQGSGYQAKQAKFALANGGIFGHGLGQGTAKWNYLPNAHNDFIFAIIGEELGFVGAFGLLALFGLFAYTGMRIARRSADPFLRLLTATTTMWVLGQVFINVAT